MKKKKLDDVGKLTADAKSALDKLKKEQQEPSKKLADLQKKIDSDRKEFDKINGPLQTAIRELENANLDLERAKSELDKATKLKANAEQLKNKLEIERDEAKKFAAEAEKEILAVSFARTELLLQPVERTRRCTHGEPPKETHMMFSTQWPAHHRLLPTRRLTCHPRRRWKGPSLGPPPKVENGSNPRVCC